MTPSTTPRRSSCIGAPRTRAATRDWLDTQARVLVYWRDLLLAAGDTGELVEALDAHAAFLERVAADPS